MASPASKRLLTVLLSTDADDDARVAAYAALHAGLGKWVAWSASARCDVVAGLAAREKYQARGDCPVFISFLASSLYAVQVRHWVSRVDPANVAVVQSEARVFPSLKVLALPRPSRGRGSTLVPPKSSTRARGRGEISKKVVVPRRRARKTGRRATRQRRRRGRVAPPKLDAGRRDRRGAGTSRTARLCSSCSRRPRGGSPAARRPRSSPAAAGRRATRRARRPGATPRLVL